MSGRTIFKAAALNTNIAVVIAQVPFISIEWLSRTRKPTMIPCLPESMDGIVQGSSSAVLADPSTVPFVEEMARRGYTWAKTVAAQSMANCSLFEPLAYIHRIFPTPLFMVVADNDTITSTKSQLEAFERALQPKTLRISRSEDHFNVYLGAAFETNVATQIEVLKEILVV
ncbi:Alpha/Beta hydrolase fold [Fusarium oxysporum f. sp. vasinfectum]|nr:Alpha/Beta hydrolase fold [Fusarium oxysporum f. sp. vasinfectum]